MKPVTPRGSVVFSFIAAFWSVCFPVLSSAEFISEFTDNAQEISSELIKSQGDVFVQLSRGPGQRSLDRTGREALKSEVRLLGRVGGETLRAAYHDNGLRDATDVFLSDPLTASAAEWGAAALVGGSIAMLSGFRTETKLSFAKLRLSVASALNMHRASGAREIGSAEFSIGRMTLAAALSRGAGRFAASRLGSRFGFDYKLRY